VYYFDRADREDLADAAANAGLRVAPVDLADCAGKHDALARIALALAFPEWFGGNWDALADSLADLSWLPASGYVLLLAHADAWRAADPAAFEALAAILEEAAGRWARERVPFWALLPTRDPPRP
jgi:hypothetical protein